VIAAAVGRGHDVPVVVEPVVIEVGQARISVRRGFDRDVLRAVVEVLSEKRETAR
jgi:hypothetical protein